MALYAGFNSEGPCVGEICPKCNVANLYNLSSFNGNGFYQRIICLEQNCGHEEINDYRHNKTLP